MPAQTPDPGAACCGPTSPRSRRRPSVRLVPMPHEDPWDFGEVYGTLYDWVRGLPLRPRAEEYWAHITTGTHVAQICLFLLVEARFIPGVLLQTAPPRRQHARDPAAMTLDRPGPLALRRASRSASSRGTARRARLPEERHRHAQPALQRADRGDRARGRALARAHPADRADRRGQVHSWRAACSS